MVESVRVVSYRSLRDVTVRLGGLTVLVGPNGSGKSALLQAIGGAQVWTQPWRRDRNAASWVEFRLAGGSALMNTPKESASPTSVLLHPSLQRMRVPAQLQPAPRLDPNAENLHNVVYALGRQGGATYAERVCAMLPGYADIDLATPGPGMHWLQFQDRWDPTLWFTPQEVSDGTLLVAAYVAATMQADAPQLLLVEEPERGLHPYLIGEIVRLFREIAAPTDGSRPVQVVAATHSADLLRHLDPAEVRFLERDRTTGETLVRQAPTDDAGWQAVVEAYEDDLGDLWMSGALGGVPGR